MASEQTTTQSSQKTVTVNATVKTESTGVLDDLRFNPWYYKTVPGIIKIVQLVIGVICMGCGSPVYINYGHFFLFVVVVCFLITLLLCFAILVSLKNITPKLPWLEGELIYTAAAVLLYLIAAIVELAMSTSYPKNIALQVIGSYDAYIAAGVFALFNTTAYGVGAFFLYQEWRSTRQTN